MCSCGEARKGAVISKWIVLAIPLLALAAGLPASACEDLTVRDAAYDGLRDIHRLCVIGKTADDSAARQIHDKLATWLDSTRGGLNLELFYLAAEDSDVRWQEYGIPSAPRSLPVVTLVGRRALERKSWVIDHWEPAPNSEDLERLRTSPAREAIRRQIGRRLAVLLYVPSTDRKSGMAERVIDAVVKTWARKEALGLSVVRVDRLDERERLLLSFSGVQASGPDWLAVVFGRGKFMPPLEGQNITEAELNAMLELLTGECACLGSPGTLGVDIPMMWDKALDQAVIRLRMPISISEAVSDPLGSAETDASAPASTSHVLASTVWTLVALVASLAGSALVWRRYHRVS